MEMSQKTKGIECFPQACRKMQGTEVSDHFRTIKFKNTAEKSFAVLDMGEKSVGGYPVFFVKHFSGRVRLRISYSDRYSVMKDENSMRKGDFVRGCCKYLGVELPVMPANPGRYEEYTITRTGMYVFPLIQGQERFVALEAEGEGGELIVQDFCIVNPVQPFERSGSFSCSDERLNKLFSACADTLDLATIRSETIAGVRGWALLRGLTQGENGVIRKGFETLTDYVYEVRFCISRNPFAASGIGLYFRAPDRKNGYLCCLDLDGTLTAYIRKDGTEEMLLRKYIAPLTDNAFYSLKAECRGDRYVIYLDGRQICTFRDKTYLFGSFGFCQLPEKWAAARHIRVSDGEQVWLDEDFGDLSGYEMVRTPLFIADGAKRDRLPWSGDLDWAFRSGFYSHGLKTAMTDTLEMFSRHQTPEGYILGTFYPEYEGGYRSREYGHYESDMFSGWYVVILETYYRYTADMALVRKLYPVVRACLFYFMRSIEADGLFNQRYETSKGLWDHQLGDFGKNSYTNLIIWECFRAGEKFSSLLGEEKDENVFRTVASAMKEGIFKHLWSRECGGFIKTLGNPVYCDMANAFAMGKELVSAEQAKTIALSAKGKTKGYGKILSLMIHGLYAYGYEALAFDMLTTPQPFYFDNGELYCYVDWMGIIDTDEFPHMTTECMHFPPKTTCNNTDWGDLSHPDSTVNDILGGDILGIRPQEDGFSAFVVDPHPYGIAHAAGEVETRFGKISVEWSAEDGKIKGKVVCPQRCRCVLEKSADFSIEYR